MKKKQIRTFKIHSEQGIPLSIQMILLVERGHDPRNMLANFYFDALSEHWSHKAILDMIEGACRDNELEFDRNDFESKTELLGRVMANKGFKAPEIWGECANNCFMFEKA